MIPWQYYCLSTTTREEVDNARSFHFQSRLAEVSLRLERPMKASNDPAGKAINVYSDVLVDLGAPRGKIPSILIETIDGLLAQSTNEVDSRLEIDTLFVHDDGDHVVSVPL